MRAVVLDWHHNLSQPQRYLVMRTGGGTEIGSTTLKMLLRRLDTKHGRAYVAAQLGRPAKDLGAGLPCPAWAARPLDPKRDAAGPDKRNLTRANARVVPIFIGFLQNLEARHIVEQ